MTTGRALGSVLVGLDAREVRITATATPCDPSARTLTIRGLPEAAERETRIRVASALAFDSHACAVTIEGLPPGASAASLDLAIAAACLRAIDALADEGSPLRFDPAIPLVGELALAGPVRSVRGAPCHARQCAALVLPEATAAECDLEGPLVWPVRRL